MEKPNLEYINQLSRGDKSIKRELIDLIKEEFPEEKKDYYISLENKEFKKIEENVHKLKHKISILGLEKSYELANEFENNLLKLNLFKSEDFYKILTVISVYIKTI
jgi:HPt (histidine-containing phosphotransfer) domain-containing protein